MLNTILFGKGRMSRILAEAIAESEDFRLAQAVGRNDFPTEKADVLIDFSAPDAIYKIRDYARQNPLPCVIATTGYGENELKVLYELARLVPVFYSQNTSVGAAATAVCAKKLSKILPQCEINIHEKHHRNKKDAPSGTAYMLAKAVCDNREISVNLPRKNAVCISCERGGTVVGEHTVGFYLDDEVVTITHAVYSRKVFALGALDAARFILDKPPELYGYNDLFANRLNSQYDK